MVRTSATLSRNQEILNWLLCLSLAKLHVAFPCSYKEGQGYVRTQPYHLIWEREEQITTDWRDLRGEPLKTTDSTKEQKESCRRRLKRSLLNKQLQEVALWAVRQHVTPHNSWCSSELHVPVVKNRLIVDNGAQRRLTLLLGHFIFLVVTQITE